MFIGNVMGSFQSKTLRYDPRIVFDVKDVSGSFSTFVHMNPPVFCLLPMTPLDLGNTTTSTPLHLGHNCLKGHKDPFGF